MSHPAAGWPMEAGFSHAHLTLPERLVEGKGAQGTNANK